MVIAALPLADAPLDVLTVAALELLAPAAALLKADAPTLDETDAAPDPLADKAALDATVAAALPLADVPLKGVCEREREGGACVLDCVPCERDGGGEAEIEAREGDSEAEPREGETEEVRLLLELTLVPGMRQAPPLRT